MSSSRPECTPIVSIISYADYLPQAAVVDPNRQEDNWTRNIAPQQVEVISANPRRRFNSPPPNHGAGSEAKVYIKSALKNSSQKYQKLEPTKVLTAERVTKLGAAEEQAKKEETKDISRISASALKNRRTKVVAFGRTTNLSETVRGADLRKATTAGNRKEKPSAAPKMEQSDLDKKVATFEEELKVLRVSVDKLLQKDKENEEKIVKQDKKIEELENEMYKLSDIVKTLLTDRNRPKDRVDRREKSKSLPLSRRNCKEVAEAYRGRENTQLEHFTKFDSDQKLKVIRRHMERDPEFEKCINEAIMRYAGDESLAELAEGGKKFARRRSEDYVGRSRANEFQPDPSILRTTRVTEHMTVEQVQRSPARSAAYSMGTTRYIEQYCKSHGDENEDDDLFYDDKSNQYASASRPLYKSGESELCPAARTTRRSGPAGRRSPEVFDRHKNHEYGLPRGSSNSAFDSLGIMSEEEVYLEDLSCDSDSEEERLYPVNRRARRKGSGGPNRYGRNTRVAS